MRATMDRVGRIVIPKAVREALGVGESAEFDVTIEGNSIRLEPRVEPERQVRRVDGWPVLVAPRGARLTDVEVRELRDADQR
jgi:AbrB family looped-hinge helix DNA binding protein